MNIIVFWLFEPWKQAFKLNHVLYIEKINNWVLNTFFTLKLFRLETVKILNIPIKSSLSLTNLI